MPKFTEADVLIEARYKFKEDEAVGRPYRGPDAPQLLWEEANPLIQAARAELSGREMEAA